ncbi:MAG: hypothetical protein NTW91_09525 [Verrucomicrobia bacterium]|nr:hypothetical protein [Verrucomicrobiota bacterium]
MIKTPYQLRYDEGEEVCTYLFTNDDVVKYSEKAGFFVQRTIWQRKAGKSWETYDSDDPGEFDLEPIYDGDELGRTPNHRSFRTYRPISRDQAIRILLHSWIDHGGMMSTIGAALDAAGIEPLRQPDC